MISFWEHFNLCAAAMSNALQVIGDRKDTWPEDEWIYLGDRNVLNLYSVDGKSKATMYPVINGRTITDEPLLRLDFPDSYIA